MNNNDLLPTKCILVDFDGTLIDSIDSLYQSYIDFLNLYHIKGNESEFNTLNGPSLLEIITYFKSKYDLPQGLNSLHKQYIEIINKNYKNSLPFKDSNLFLSSLHKNKIKVILVTSSQKKTCLPLIEKFNWSQYFDAYIWGDEVKNSKPNPDIYKKAICHAKENLNIYLNNIIIVEDSLNGVKSGSKAGGVVIGLSNHTPEQDLFKSGANKVFKNLSQALNYILTNT